MLPSLGGFQVTIMEARNFITAREMLSDGNWILTTMNGIPRYEKPPLPTWITAISGFIFGIKNVFVLRLPTIIMVSSIGVYTYLFSKQFLKKQHSFINGLIAITSLYVVAITIEAPWDIYTHGFMLIAIFYLTKGYSSKQIWHLIPATLFIAFSVLSKGPVSLYALLLPFLIAYVIVFGFKNKFLVKSIIPLAGGIVLGGIWFVYVRFADTEAFIEIASRETANWSSYQVKPFYYYWSFFTQSGLWAIPAFIALLYPYLIKRVNNKTVYKLSFLWTIFAVILLSVIPEKKSRYLMPVLIPLAINTGFYIQYLIREFALLKQKTQTLPVYFNFGLLGILGLFFPLIGFFIFRGNINGIIPNYILASVLISVIGFLLLLQLYRKRMLLVFYLSILLYAAIMSSAVPMLTMFQNKNEAFAPISDLKHTMDEQNLKLFLFDEISPEMLWDYGEKMASIEKENGSYKLPGMDKFALLVNSKEKLMNSNLTRYFELEEKATYNRNVAKQGSRRHRTRNINYLFILSKKDIK